MTSIEDEDRDRRSGETDPLPAVRRHLALLDTETTRARPDATNDTHTDAFHPIATLAHCQHTRPSRLPRETAPGQDPSAAALQSVRETTHRATECLIETARGLLACARRRVALPLSVRKAAGTLAQIFHQPRDNRLFPALPTDPRRPARPTLHLDRDTWDPLGEASLPAVLVVAGAPVDLLVQVQAHQQDPLHQTVAQAFRLGLAALFVARVLEHRRKGAPSTLLLGHLPSTRGLHASLSHRAL